MRGLYVDAENVLGNGPDEGIPGSASSLSPSSSNWFVVLGCHNLNAQGSIFPLGLSTVERVRLDAASCDAYGPWGWRIYNS